jgi:hypothetical protein
MCLGSVIRRAPKKARKNPQTKRNQTCTAESCSALVGATARDLSYRGDVKPSLRSCLHSVNKVASGVLVACPATSGLWSGCRAPNCPRRFGASTSYLSMFAGGKARVTAASRTRRKRERRVRKGMHTQLPSFQYPNGKRASDAFLSSSLRRKK